MKHIAQLLVAENVVQTNFANPFTWTSGIKSPIYCDCRNLISFPEARDTIVSAFEQVIQERALNHDYLVGPATGGIPWASFLADRLKVPMLYVRKAPKGHGAGKMVEGVAHEDKPNMLVIEDAFSTGGSSIKSANALRNELGAEVTHILGIFSWSAPASSTNAKEAKVELIALTEFDEIAAALLEAGKITEDEKASLERFHDSPADWAG